MNPNNFYQNAPGAEQEQPPEMNQEGIEPVDYPEAETPQ
jgi:hypothetical protein